MARKILPPSRGKPGEKVENSEHGVGFPKPSRKSCDSLVGRKEQSQTDKNSSQETAREGSCDGYVEFLNGFRGIALDSGDAAEDEECDRDNADFIVLGDDAVGKFMEEQ